MGVIPFVIFSWTVFVTIVKVIVDVCKLLFRFAVWLFETICWLIEEFLKFIGPVYNSVRGSVNKAELYRVVTLAMSVGGGFWAAVEYVYTHLGEFVTDPTLVLGFNTFVSVVKTNWLFVVIPVVIFFGDFLRRKFTHGSLPNESL